MDVQKIRDEFPVLQQKVHGGKRLAYLDNAATSQNPQSVIDALIEYYSEYNSNVHRALHALSERSTLAFEGARTKVADFIGADDEELIVFTRGTTEAVNLVASSWGGAQLNAGDEIVVTMMEHHSNLVPWQMIAAKTGATLQHVPVAEDGTLDLDVYKSLLSERTRLVSFTHMSNLLGTINPASEMIEAAHQAGAAVFLDGAQSVPHMPVDVEALDVDFMAFSGHKMLAPTGIGVLYGKRELLESMPPYQGGGEMIHKVWPDRSTYAEVPYKFEAGTPNISGAIGLGAAIDYLQGLGMEAIYQQETVVANLLIERLKQVEGVRIYGEAKQRGGAVSFTMEGVHPHDLSQYVDQQGVAIRAGHMCCQPLIKSYGLSAMNRASTYFYNNEEDIEQLISALDGAGRFFRHA